MSVKSQPRLSTPPGLQPLRAVRIERKLSQKAVGDAIGERQEVISRLELGVFIPSATQLARLCKTLKARPIELFTRTLLAECESRAKAAL